MTKKRKKGMSLASKITHHATMLIKRNVKKQSKIDKDRKGRLVVTKREINGAAFLSGLRSKDITESLHDLKNTLSNKEVRNTIIPYSFPKTVEIKESVRYKDSQHGLLYDIEFEAIILKSFGEEIKEFLLLQNEYDNSILRSEQEEASCILNEIFNKFGYSNWYISSKLNVIVELGDSKQFLDYHKEITNQFKENHYNNLSEVHLSYPFIRCDKGVSYERYTFAIQHQSEEFKLSRKKSIIEQIDFSHCYSPEKNYNHLSEIICENSSNNIIDRYLSFRRIITSSYLHKKLEKFDLSTIVDLYFITGDNLLRNILYRQNAIDFSYNKQDEEIAEICNSYFKGDYKEAAYLCNKIIEKKPTTTSIIEIYVKSLIRIKERPQKKSLINSIINIIIDLYTEDNKNEIVKLLLKDFLRFYHCNWSYFIKLQCEKFLVTSDDEPIEFLYSFLDLNNSLANLFSNEKFNDLDTKNTPLHNETLYLISENLEIKTNIEKGRKLKTLGDKYYQEKDYPKAYYYYNELTTIDDSLYKDHALSRLSLCLFKQGEIDDAFENIANLIKISSNSIYPCIKEFSMGIINGDNSAVSLSQLIDRAVILHTFNNLKNKDYSFILTVICEDILDRLEISCAEDIYIDERNSYLFEKILSFDAMETFDIFSNNKEIFLFRMISLQRLVNYGNKSDHEIDTLRAEMFRTLEKLVKEICIIDCGSGRIEVDTISVKINAVNKFTEEFESLKRLEKIPFKDSDYTEIEKDESTYNYSSNTYYAKILDLFYKIRDEYTISPLYGLDNFLNLNIRHGGIVNLLLGPIKTHKLFYLKNDKGVYERENYWFEQYVYLKKDNRQLIDDAFRNFSKSIDKEVQMAKEWIHINTGEFSEGDKVFNFFSEINVIEKLGEQIDEKANVEDFVNLIIDYLITQTNNALEVLKKRIDTVLRKNINNCFEKLHSDIKSISRLDELKRKIRLSQREVNEKVSELISWMEWKNETNNPFLIGSSLDAALDMAKSLHPNIKIDVQYVDTTHISVKGDFFRRFVTIFLILIENAINHSQMRETIFVGINIQSPNSENIVIKFSNKLHASAIPRIDGKIEKLKPLINSNYIIGANGESGSGLYKIKKLFSYDMRIKNNLDLSLDLDDSLFNLCITLMREQLNEH